MRAAPKPSLAFSIVAVALLACRARPPAPSTAPAPTATVAPTASASVAPSPSAAPTVQPTAVAPVAPFSRFTDDGELLDEAAERASLRVRAQAGAVRMRAVDFGFQANYSAQRVSLVDPAEPELVPSFARECAAQTLALDEPARRALLTEFIAAARRAVPDPADTGWTLEDKVDEALAARPFSASAGCATAAGNALVEMRLGAYETIMVRRAGASLADIADSGYHRSVSRDGVLTPYGGGAYADLTGDGVPDALRAFSVGGDEARREVIELYSADAPRAQRLPELRRNVECARDARDELVRVGCRSDTIDGVTLVYDADRWMLRVGLRTYRVNAQGRLVAAPATAPAVAAYLALAQRHEVLLEELETELSRETPLALRRGSVVARLVALGESAEDAARAEQRVVNLDAARDTGRPLPHLTQSER